MKSRATKPRLRPVEPPLRLDLGCGPNPREGFAGVDVLPFDGKVAHVLDLRHTPWPWADGSVAEAQASHLIEHFTAPLRVQFCNELYRVLMLDGTCHVIVPHWASCRAYGDPTHQWPPVSEFWFYYLHAEWRMANAPHTDRQHTPEGLACHFEATWGYTLRPDLAVRNQDYQQFATQNYKEVCQDLVATLTKRAWPKGLNGRHGA